MPGIFKKSSPENEYKRGRINAEQFLKNEPPASAILSWYHNAYSCEDNTAYDRGVIDVLIAQRPDLDPLKE